MAVAGMVIDGGNEFIIPCIRSLFDTTRDAPFDVRVTAIDNSPGSSLGAALRREFPAIQVVENRVPLGYAANQNAALFGSDAEYFLVANDDIVFRPGALARAVDYLETAVHARVGVVGFRQLNPDGTLQPSTYSFPTVPRVLLNLTGLRSLIPFSRWTSGLARVLGRGDGRSRFWAHDRTLPVQTFRGSAMLVRARAAREVGPMDEVSLGGGEEVEWHKRFWDRGWDVFFLHDAVVVHHGGQTTGKTPGMQVEYLKGFMNYFGKHRSPFVAYGFRLAAAPILALRAAAYLVTGLTPEAAVMWSSAKLAAGGLLNRGPDA